jgi:putative colanic acid biosynthesis UDP-glucose lipid carrier transferase
LGAAACCFLHLQKPFTGKKAPRGLEKFFEKVYNYITKMKNGTHSPAIRIILLDLLMMTIINAVFVYNVKGYRYGKTAQGERYLLLVILLNLLWIIINLVITRYKMEVNRDHLTEIKKNLAGIVLFAGIVSAFAFMFKDLKYSRVIVYGTLAGFFIARIASHMIILSILKKWRRKNRIKKQILIVGSDHSAIDLYNVLAEDKDYDYEVIVYIESDTLESEIDEHLVLGKLTDAAKIFEQHKIDELYIVVSSSQDEEIKQLVERADYHGARVRMVPTFFKLFEQNFKVNLFGPVPVINVNECPLDNYYSAMYKRSFDVGFSLLNLVLLSPLLLIIGLLVKLTGRGPVLYVAERVGVGGSVFKLFKFRTMYPDACAQEDRSTVPNDSRVTPLGRFLRRFSLDELPQFFNVLMGDMSVVGPRPHRVYLEKVMQHSVDKYMVRHYVKPGITGWAQVNGWRGPTGTEEQKVQRTRHDLWYIKNWSFPLDLKIIILTLWAKKSRHNAF